MQVNNVTNLLSVGELPCRGRLQDPVLYVSSTVRPKLLPMSYDICAQLQERTGCTLRDRAAESLVSERDLDLSVVFDGTTDGVIQTTNIVSETCKLPDRPLDCAARIQCEQPAGGGAFTTSLGAESADVFCSNDASAAVPLDETADLAMSPEYVVSASTAFEACLEDAMLARQAPAGATLDDLFAAGTCFDTNRMLTVISAGLSTPQREGRFAMAKAASESRLYATRMLSRWLRAHAFAASEAVQRHQMAAPFANDPNAASPPLDATLDASMSALDVLLHPRILAGLATLSPEELRDPDYRSRRLAVMISLDDEQRIGLPAVLLDTMARQANLLELIIEENWRRGIPDPDARFAAFSSRAMALQTLAQGLYARTQAGETNFDWRSDYESAEARYRAAMGRVYQLARAIEQGANPLGIEDDDLPLYFLGEATGAGGRFAAVSDFLLGSGPDSDGWAPALVKQAQSLLDSARASYIAQLDRDYLVERTTGAHVAWVEDVTAYYNGVLRDYCGPISASLVEDSNFNAVDCAFNRADPGCKFEVPGYFDLWTQDDFNFRMCQNGVLTYMYGTEGQVGFPVDAVRKQAARCWDEVAEKPGKNARLERCVSADTGTCLVCDGETQVPLNHAADLTVQFPVVKGYNWNQLLKAQMATALSATCIGQYPTARQFFPTERSAFDIPGCIGGSLGEAYLDISAAERRIRIAQSEFDEFQESYDIAMQSCVIMEKTAAKIEEKRKKHAARMQRLRVAKATADSAAAALGSAKECTGNLAGLDKINPLSIASCALGAGEAAANIASIGLQAKMDKLVQEHENEIAALEAQSEIRICENDALQSLVGQRTQALELEQAVFDAERAFNNLRSLTDEANLQWEEGYWYVRDIQGRNARPPAGDLWADETVTRYHNTFRLARRATYLAVRAVEYEFQATLAARDAVLEAETPAELEAVLLDLFTTAGTRSVGGSRPSELHVVLSLRDDILALTDEGAREPGDHPLNREERLRIALSTPDHAVYDEEGRYLGQEIPFSLTPLGALGLETNGVPIYGTTDCAERLWSVNASVLGDEVYVGRDTSFVRMDVLKQNVFYSQWCDGSGRDTTFQSASVNPSRNLFREPGVGASVGDSAFGVGQGLQTRSRARIQAFLNVDRATLEDPSYEAGETAELAARGLFGDYALFIPAELIAREASDGGFTPGLVLSNVDDILIRVDYVSVARD